MKHLQNHKEFLEFLRSNKRTLTYFFSNSCIKCKEFSNELEKVDRFCFVEKIEFCKVNIYDDLVLNSLFKEYGVPTFIVFEGDQDGKEIPYPKEGYTAEYIINYMRNYE